MMIWFIIIRYVLQNTHSIRNGLGLNFWNSFERTFIQSHTMASIISPCGSVYFTYTIVIYIHQYYFGLQSSDPVRPSFLAITSSDLARSLSNFRTFNFSPSANLCQYGL